MRLFQPRGTSAYVPLNTLTYIDSLPSSDLGISASSGRVCCEDGASAVPLDGVSGSPPDQNTSLAAEAEEGDPTTIVDGRPNVGVFCSDCV